MAQAQTKSRPSVRVAAPQRQNIVPAFTVKKLEGTRKEIVHFFDAQGKRQQEVKERPKGYLVKFSKGHSITVKDDDNLKRLGFDQTIPLVDGNDDVHGYLPNDVLGGGIDDDGNLLTGEEE